MKRFRFNLEKVLSLYRLRREGREREVQSCVAKQTQLSQKLERVRKEFREFVEWMPLAVGSVGALRQRIRRHEYLDALQAADSILCAEIAKVERELTFRRNRLLQARRNEKALLKLKEKRYLKWKEDAEKEDRKFLDEIGTQRFIRQQGLRSQLAHSVSSTSGGLE